MAVTLTRELSDIAVLDHREAIELAELEYGRFADLLDSLTADDWSAGTCCTGWTVREIAGHVLGSMRSSAVPSEQRRQLRLAKTLVRQQQAGSVADGLTSIQVGSTAALTTDELRREVRAVLPAAVRGRRRVPAPLRRLVSIPSVLPVSGHSERWRLGYLIDEILTRDVWMHRSDIAEATGATFVATADHDGRLVETVVSDWARRHRRDVRLVLGGPAGGVFTRGTAATDLVADSVAFCRSLSGRSDDLPYGTEVPF